MRLLGLDFETTGLDTGNDRITEIGMVLWDGEKHRPLLQSSIFVYDPGIEERLTPETVLMMERVCGLTPQILKEFGVPAPLALSIVASMCEIHKPEYIVAHNGENYDRPLLMAELARHGTASDFLRSLPWIDTRVDIPFEHEPDSRKLKHMALDVGFINPFPHRAVSDVLTMLKILSCYDLEKVIAYSKIPFVTVRAMVDYKDRELAKARRFSWEKLGDKVFPKQWIKKIKLDQLEKERAECSFTLVQLS